MSDNPIALNNNTPYHPDLLEVHHVGDKWWLEDGVMSFYHSTSAEDVLYKLVEAINNGEIESPLV